MSPLEQQIAQLESAIGTQEALRSTLGDAAVEAALVGIRAKLQALRAQRRAEAGLNQQLDQLTTAGLIRPVNAWADNPTFRIGSPLPKWRWP